MWRGEKGWKRMVEFKRKGVGARGVRERARNETETLAQEANTSLQVSGTVTHHASVVYRTMSQHLTTS